MPFRIPLDFLGTGDWNWDAAHVFLNPLELQGRKSRGRCRGNSALCSLCHLKQKGPGSHSHHLTALHQRHTTQIPQSSSHLLFTKSTANRRYLTLNIPLHYYHETSKTISAASVRIQWHRLTNLVNYWRLQAPSSAATSLRWGVCHLNANKTIILLDVIMNYGI